MVAHPIRSDPLLQFSRISSWVLELITFSIPLYCSFRFLGLDFALIHFASLCFPLRKMAPWLQTHQVPALRPSWSASHAAKRPVLVLIFSDRLVHPPVLLCIELSIIFPLVNKILPFSDLGLVVIFWTFLGLGYITYDLMHYSLHHIDTSNHKGGWFHRLQQYHNQHHFGGEDAGFGVSSPLWDFIIGTTYKNKKKWHDLN